MPYAQHWVFNENEQLIYDAVRNGNECVLRDTTTPTNADFVRGEVLAAIIASPPSRAGGEPSFLQLENAHVRGPVDLTDRTISPALALYDCRFDAAIVLDHAHLSRFDAVGLKGDVISAQALTCATFFSLEACEFNTVILDRCSIGKMLSMDRHNGQSVQMRSAKIGDQLSLNGATLEHPHIDALNADGATIEGDVFCNEGFTAKGGVNMLGTKIGGQLSLNGATLENPDGAALRADRATIEGDVFCNEGFTAKGEVRLLGAKIGVQLGLDGAVLMNSEGSALNADRATVAGGVFCHNFVAEGEVRLPGAKIGGQLSLDEAQIRNGNEAFPALNVDGASIEGGVSCKRFVSHGEMRFFGAKIGGPFSLKNAELANVEGHALNIEGASIDGTTVFEDVHIAGHFTPPAVFVGFLLISDCETNTSTLEFDRTRFRGGALIQLSPSTAESKSSGLNLVSFDNAAFESPVRIVHNIDTGEAVDDAPQLPVAPTTFTFRNASGSSPMLFTSCAAKIVLDGCALAAGSAFASALDRGDHTDVFTPPVKIVSVNRAQLGGLVFESVDVSECEFRRAYGVEQLRIAGLSQFVTTAKREVPRRVVRDELVWQARSTEDSASTPDPAEIESVYRALRQAAETNSDFSGASDFYFGEMEMRRRSSRTSKGTKALLWIYGASSGYATHPPFAGSLLAMFIGITALLANLSATHSCPASADSSSIARSVLDIAHSISTLLTDGSTCGAIDTGLSLFGLLTLVFLALTAFSIRSRVKR